MNGACERVPERFHRFFLIGGPMAGPPLRSPAERLGVVWSSCQKCRIDSLCAGVDG